MNDRKELLYTDELDLIYPDKDKKVRTITFQVTDNCNLKCTYCYQINKGKRVMSFETAKKLIDLILEPGPKNTVITPENTKGIILDFIGGEPLLQAKLISDIIDYFQYKALIVDSPFKDKFRASLCTNGVLFFSKDAQDLINNHRDILSLAVTVDGCKEMHDSCRVFPDGSPSYDLALAADKALLKLNTLASTKLTVSPENINSIYKASINMIELGHKCININCVFEEGWNIKHARILYNQLKKVADYLLALPDSGDIYYAFFNETKYQPLELVNNENYCGGTGDMLACDPDGILYPCIRYMESSLGTDIKPLIIGNVDDGIYTKPEEIKIKDDFSKITRTSQSPEKCMKCNVAAGCAWCSAYNYQRFGTVNKRATFICDMHKAASLANVYYWNKRYKKENVNKHFDLYCDIKDAIKIIGIKELNYLLSL